MTRTRKLAAIMFTDIQGYTALMQQSEKQALALRDKHRRVFEEVTRSHKGQIINFYGDGTLSIFDSAVDAVNCGHDLQLQFLTEPLIPVRIGIHMGDIIVTDDDIIGDGVNIASRVESLAVVGSVLFSEKVKAEIRNQENLQWKEIGSFRFKNDDRDRNIFALDMPGLNVPHALNIDGKTEKTRDNEKEVVDSSKQSPSKWLRWTIGIAAILLLGALGFREYNKQQGKQWAIQEAIPQIEKYRDEKNFRDAYILALEAEKRLKEDFRLQALWPIISIEVDLDSKPPGAKVYRKTYVSSDQDWDFIGNTPLRGVRTYQGESIWKLEKEGFHSSIRLNPFPLVTLDAADSSPEDMVRIETDSTNLEMVMGFGVNHPVERVNSFLMDQYEVTNQDYQAFVNAGGYQEQKYWRVPFKKSNQSISFKEAIQEFRDQTDRPGPAEWELGEYPKGQDQLPVTGICWYEAAAYAEYVDKSLPTIYHWDIAADVWLSDLVVPASNIQAEQLEEVGSFSGITSSGVYDLAGNVKEWLWNGSEWNQGRYVIGGAWNDPAHTYNEAAPIDPFNRSSTTGFRCIKYQEPNHNQEALEKDAHKEAKLFGTGNPVSDEKYELYLRQFNFDKTPFNVSIENIPVALPDRTCEKIEFDAAYGGERMSAYLFLPDNAQPPYQTIVYFPGTGAIWTPEFDPDHDFQLQLIDFVLKSGRAIFYPVLKSTFNRQDGLPNSNPSASVNYRDHAIMWMKDIIRSVDYLETRPDIQIDKIGYYGLSWGARFAALCLAVEKRFKTGVLISGGISIHTPLEEVAEYTYLPRVKIPVLMLNGLHDHCCFPVEAAQKPFFNLLGTDAKNKKHVLFENAAHLPARADLINESFEWFDRYLGFVK